MQRRLLFKAKGGADLCGRNAGAERGNAKAKGYKAEEVTQNWDKNDKMWEEMGAEWKILCNFTDDFLTNTGRTRTAPRKHWP